MDDECSINGVGTDKEIRPTFDEMCQKHSKSMIRDWIEWMATTGVFERYRQAHEDVPAWCATHLDEAEIKSLDEWLTECSVRPTCAIKDDDLYEVLWRHEYDPDDVEHWAEENGYGSAWDVFYKYLNDHLDHEELKSLEEYIQRCILQRTGGVG